ncbi:hypothetical protein GIB67_025516, partial [Kingdonia uniflora]
RLEVDTSLTDELPILKIIPTGTFSTYTDVKVFIILPSAYIYIYIYISDQPFMYNIYFYHIYTSTYIAYISINLQYPNENRQLSQAFPSQRCCIATYEIQNLLPYSAVYHLRITLYQIP